MKLSTITGKGNYFEDFTVGAVYQHARGKTMTEMDNVLLTNLVMNTAQAHFNEHQMAATPLGRRIVFGGVTLSLVIGLAMQDTGENALRELALDKVRFKVPVFHGDTLFAYTEVLEKREPTEEERAGIKVPTGVVKFRHYGVNQDGKVVCEAERLVLVKHRPTT